MLRSTRLQDWFIENAGADSWDEWDFTATLGQEKSLEVLSQHWDTWITEDDMDVMFNHGINHIRIPTGYWAWIPTTGDEPYLNNSAVYQAQIDKVLGWAYARGMYVVLDLHGLPGSQNGEQASGHNTTTPAVSTAAPGKPDKCCNLSQTMAVTGSGVQTCDEM
jgi:aryl-phospho-beta-D-glucosidase BglC (GH1 family)